MFHTQRPASFYGFPVQSTPASYEEQYYRQVANEHHRRADAALVLAQQERDRAVLRQRQLQAQARIRAMEREREHQLHLARARAEQQRYPVARQAPYHHPVSPFFQGQRPRSCAAAPQVMRRRQQPEESQDGQFLNFLAQVLNGSQPEEKPAVSKPQVQKKEEVRGHPQTQEQAAQPQSAPKEQEERGDFITNILQTLRSGESDDFLREMGLLPAPKTSPSATNNAPRQTPKRPAPTPVSVPAKNSTSPATSNAPSSPLAQSFTSIDKIQHQFDSLKASFQFPTTLEFDASSPKLPYNSTNAPVHAYESELVKLLTKLDAVDSDGAESVRGARRGLVLAVEKELDAVDAEKERLWKASQHVEEPAVEAAVPEVVEPQLEVSEVQAETVEATAEPIAIDEVDATAAEVALPVAADEVDLRVAEPATEDHHDDQTPTQEDTVVPTIESAPEQPALDSELPVSPAFTEEANVDGDLLEASPEPTVPVEEDVMTTSPQQVEAELLDDASESSDEESAAIDTVYEVAAQEGFDVLDEAMSESSSDDMVDVDDIAVPTPTSLKAKVFEDSDSDDFEMI